MANRVSERASFALLSDRLFVVDGDGVTVSSTRLVGAFRVVQDAINRMTESLNAAFAEGYFGERATDEYLARFHAEQDGVCIEDIEIVERAYDVGWEADAS